MDVIQKDNQEFIHFWYIYWGHMSVCSASQYCCFSECHCAWSTSCWGRTLGYKGHQLFLRPVGSAGRCCGMAGPGSSLGGAVAVSPVTPVCAATPGAAEPVQDPTHPRKLPEPFRLPLEQLGRWKSSKFQGAYLGDQKTNLEAGVSLMLSSKVMSMKILPDSQTKLLISLIHVLKCFHIAWFPFKSTFSQSPVHHNIKNQFATWLRLLSIFQVFGGQKREFGETWYFRGYQTLFFEWEAS